MPGDRAQPTAARRTAGFTNLISPLGVAGAYGTSTTARRLLQLDATLTNITGSFSSDQAFVSLAAEYNETVTDLVRSPPAEL